MDENGRVNIYNGSIVLLQPARPALHKARSNSDVPINEISWCNNLDAFVARHCKQIIIATDDCPGVAGYCAGNELIVIRVS